MLMLLVYRQYAFYYDFFAHNKMRLYQMDIKSAFLNRLIQEKVYVEQLLGFENDTFPRHVFKLNKAL